MDTLYTGIARRIPDKCPKNAPDAQMMPKRCPKPPTGMLPSILASKRLAWSRVSCSRTNQIHHNQQTNHVNYTDITHHNSCTNHTTTSTTHIRGEERGRVISFLRKSGGDEEPCILEVVTMSYMLVKVVGETEEEIFFPSEMRLLWGQYIALRGWFCTERWNGLCIHTLYKTNNQVARDSIHNVYGIFNLFSKFAKEMKKRVSW